MYKAILVYALLHDSWLVCAPSSDASICCALNHPRHFPHLSNDRILNAHQDVSQQWHQADWSYIRHACCPFQMFSRALFVALADGAGGKGTWGKEGEMYDPDAPDPKDPNYESGDEGIVMEATEEVKK